MSTSDATYHSFHDIELFAPATPPKVKPTETREKQVADVTVRTKETRRPDDMPSANPMTRQDSGYESIQPRLSTSSTPTSNGKRRVSNASSASSSQPLAQTGTRTPSRPSSSRAGRPTIRRAGKTSPYPVRSSAGQVQALYTSRAQPFALSCNRHQSTHSGFFHFPVHPTDLEMEATTPSSKAKGAPSAHHKAVDVEPESPATQEQMPPQSTHYWTSDRTRRLEYAAIDAAHRGLKGWVRRHLVPGCFLPKEKGHVAFDDDTGSVRRYRLELDEECPAMAEKRSKWGRMKSW